MSGTEPVFRLDWVTPGRVICNADPDPLSLIYWANVPDLTEDDVSGMVPIDATGFLIPASDQGQAKKTPEDWMMKRIDLNRHRFLSDFLERNDNPQSICSLVAEYGYLHQHVGKLTEQSDEENLDHEYAAHLETLSETAERYHEPPAVHRHGSINTKAYWEHLDYWRAELHLLWWAVDVLECLALQDQMALERKHQEFQRACRQETSTLASLEHLLVNLGVSPSDDVADAPSEAAWHAILLRQDYQQLQCLAPDAGADAFRNTVVQFVRRRVDLGSSVSIGDDAQVQVTIEVSDLRAAVWLQCAQVKAANIKKCVQCGKIFNHQGKSRHHDRMYCSGACRQAASRAKKRLSGITT